MDPSSLVDVDPEILGGTPVFSGTRVPMRIRFEYFAAGDSLEDFIQQFPSVNRKRAVGVLELASSITADGARSSG